VKTGPLPRERLAIHFALSRAFDHKGLQSQFISYSVVLAFKSFLAKMTPLMCEILRAWTSLEHSQWYEKPKLVKLRENKLSRIVEHAYRTVPFYRRLYEDLGVDPGKVKRLSDLAKLPLVTRKRLQEAGIEARTAIGTDLNACTMQSTSGTSGMRLHFYEDQTSGVWSDALNLRLLWAYGYRPFQRLCRTRVNDPCGRVPKPKISDVGLWGFVRRHGMKQILYNTEPAEAVLALADWRPDIIFGNPAYLRLLAKSAKTNGVKVKCKTIITAGQLLDNSTRDFIGKTFQAEVYDHYGLEEVGGSVAWECPTHYGYHVNDECLILEFLRDGRTVASGEEGEIYITSLTRTVAPIIRYATGDIGVPLDHDCKCGRGLSLLKNIQGRIMDYVITQDGKWVPSISIISAIEEIQGIEQYKVLQNEDRTIQVLVMISNGMESQVFGEARQVCLDLFGDTPVRILKVDRVEHASGTKFRIVESALTKSPVE